MNANNTWGILTYHKTSYWILLSECGVTFECRTRWQKIIFTIQSTARSVKNDALLPIMNTDNIAKSLGFPAPPRAQVLVRSLAAALFLPPWSTVHRLLCSCGLFWLLACDLTLNKTLKRMEHAILSCVQNYGKLQIRQNSVSNSRLFNWTSSSVLQM